MAAAPRQGAGNAAAGQVGGPCHGQSGWPELVSRRSSPAATLEMMAQPAHVPPPPAPAVCGETVQRASLASPRPKVELLRLPQHKELLPPPTFAKQAPL